MVESNESPYKYSCRKCPIRERCIDYSDSAPTIKAQIRNAFANKTDTIHLWANLQTHCLLIKADEEAKKGTTESLLSRRLRRARQARETTTSAPDTKPQSPTIGAPSAAPGNNTLPPSPNITTPLPPQKTTFPPKTSPLRPDTGTLRHGGRRYWLTLPASGRHIGLPVDGAIVIGRFDPSFGIPPDVDLSFEDMAHDSISRRHARITGKEGIHSIEEMGSRAGIIINGQKLSLGTSRRLYEGDTLIMGKLMLRYGIMPGWVQRLHQYPDVEHTLTVAATGDQWILAPEKPLTIGRSDRFVGYTADIDVSPFGPVTTKVSRRHALITYQPEKARWLIEDMGSGFGTKINGELILPGRQHKLIPGDHIWMGGFVLAYDVIIR